MVAVLEKYAIPYDVCDITRDASAYKEMVEKSGQTSSPCVEFDGYMLADVGGEEVESWLKERGLVAVVYRG